MSGAFTAPPCAVGRTLLHAEIPGFDAECPRPGRSTIYLTDTQQTLKVCIEHEEQLDALGVLDERSGR